MWVCGGYSEVQGGVASLQPRPSSWEPIIRTAATARNAARARSCASALGASCPAHAFVHAVRALQFSSVQFRPALLPGLQVTLAPDASLFAASFHPIFVSSQNQGSTPAHAHGLTGVGLQDSTHSGQDFGFRYESGLWLAGWVVLSARPEEDP